MELLIITNGEMQDCIWKELTKRLMAVSGNVGYTDKRPLEVTVINQNDIIPWQFPPKCEYMYGEWLREEMDEGEIPKTCCDPDLEIIRCSD